MSDKKLEKRINIKFCVKIGKNASETLALLTVACGVTEYCVLPLSSWSFSISLVAWVTRCSIS
jgi:hypothetical protein